MKKTTILSAAMLLMAHIMLAQSAARTTATSSRLIAQTILYYDGISYTIDDSGAMVYSGSRGGDLTHTLKYDVDNHYYSTDSAMILSGRSSQSFDANNNLLLNLIQSLDLASGEWRNFMQFAYTYDGNNNMLTYRYDMWNPITSAWITHYNFLYTYDVNNNNLTYTVQQLVGDTVINHFRYMYTYDAGNKRRSKTSADWNSFTGLWDVQDSINYSYTATGKIAGEDSLYWMSSASAWVYAYKKVYTYNAADSLISAIDSNWDAISASWHDGVHNDYTYNPSGNLLTASTWYLDTAVYSWEAGTNIIYGDYADGNPQTITYQQAAPTSDTFVNNTRSYITYNTFGQATSYYSYAWVDGTWQPQSGTSGGRYYYDSYTTDVHNINSENCNISIYPIPAKDMLHVSATWNEPQAFTIQITDMSGRVVSQWHMPQSKTYDGNLTISNLSPGNYIMNITGTSAHSIQQIVISQ